MTLTACHETVRNKHELHVPVVARTLSGKDLFPSTCPCNVISYCDEGDKPSISASLTCPGSAAVKTGVATSGAVTCTQKSSNAPWGADQAKRMLAEETLNVRLLSLSSGLSDSEPELVTAAAGASVLVGRRRRSSSGWD